jgi:hypothetical protein
LGIIIWKSICKKDGHHGEGEILDRTLEQSAGFFWFPLFTAVDYSTGFIAFTVILLLGLSLILYTNNVLDLTPEQYEGFPFRIP